MPQHYVATATIRRCPGEAKYYHPATSLCQKDCDVASMEVDLADVSNVENPLEPKITPFVCPINTHLTSISKGFFLNEWNNFSKIGPEKITFLSCFFMPKRCVVSFSWIFVHKNGSTRWLDVFFWNPPGMELVKWWSVMRRVVQRLAAVTNVFAPWKTDMKMKEARGVVAVEWQCDTNAVQWLRVGFLKGVQGLRWDATFYSIAQFCEKHCFHRVSEHQGEPGHCAYRGSCLEEAKFNKAEHLCQHNTFVSCRVWGCPSTLGETKCDGFLSGLGTYNCLCEDEKENGNCWNEC